MVLQLALRQILIENGIEFLNSSNTIDILEEKNAFIKYKSLKFVFGILYSEGYIERMIKDLKCGNYLIIEKYVDDVFENYGIRKDVVNYIINALKNELESFDYSSNTSKIANNSLSTSKHLTFKNWEINGELDDFCQTLIKGGYILQDKFDDAAFLKGEFAGNSNCSIIVLYSKYINSVWKVAVYLPEINNWYNLKSEYLKYKEVYSKKYGTPESYEFFEDPYYEGDGYEMSAVSNGNCTYSSYFSQEKGTIIVSIGNTQKIMLGYEDKINANLHSEEKEKYTEMEI